MSNVKVRDRKKSGFQVVDTADELVRKTTQFCMRMPKRYTNLVLERLVTIAIDVSEACHQANFYPKNAHEAQIRRDWFIRARGSLITLISLVSLFFDSPEYLVVKDPVTKESGNIPLSEFDNFLDALDNELALISGAIDKDTERFNSLN